jgi:hypothetical protein
VIKIARLPTVGEAWSQEDTERLAKLLDVNSSQVDIAAAFPERKWKPIRDKIFRMRGKKAAVFSPKLVRDFETYSEFQARIEANPRHQSKVRHKWRDSEVDQLLNMLASGSTKMEIAQAFPYRKWTHIRTRVSFLKGHDFEIPGNKPMRSKETYLLYQERINKEENEAFEDQDSNMLSDTSSTTTRPYSSACAWRARRPG